MGQDRKLRVSKTWLYSYCVGNHNLQAHPPEHLGLAAAAAAAGGGSRRHVHALIQSRRHVDALAQGLPAA
eukprot:scaffold50892_cov18-Tisochrysis_lutea.AAC.1